MKIDKKLFLGIVCSVIGGFVGSLPWFLAFAFGNVMVGILSMFIALGSYYGFKLTKNKIDKTFPKVVYLSTIVVVTISLIFIMPITRQVLNGYSISFEWLLKMLKNWNSLSSFLFNYIVSIGMALIGAISVVVTVNKKEYEKEKYGENKLKDIFSYKSVTAEELQKLKDTFNKNNAMAKETAIEREKIVSDLSENMVEARAIQIFNLICDQQIIRKYKGKYYFSEKAQNDQLYRNSKTLIISLIASAVIIVLMIAFMLWINNNKGNSDLENQSEQTKTIVEIRENEHVIGNTGIKFVPKDGLMLLTKSEKEKYKNVVGYEFIAMNENHHKTISCILYDVSKTESDLSAKDYLERVFAENKRSDITETSIADVVFEKVTLKQDEIQEGYILDCYIAKIGEKFLCFNYWHLKDEQGDFSNMLEKIEC